MKSLRVIRAKPNPLGKDRFGSFTPPKQLAAEWVDFQNNGTEAFPLERIKLYHIAYQPRCTNGKWELVMSFKGSLHPGKVIRVHSGNHLPEGEMFPEDVVGADFHLFTGKNYIWNNDCGDSPGLWDGLIWVDKAFYDPYPPEGHILVRDGDKLVSGY